MNHAVQSYGAFRLRAVGNGSLEGARLFRSAQLGTVAPCDAAVITQHLGIRVVYDLRSQHEADSSPEPALPGVALAFGDGRYQSKKKDAGKRLVAGVIGEYGAPGQRMVRNYRRYVTGFPRIKDTIQSLASNDAPSLIHCVNGKDRTGVVCATILHIAGVHADDIMEDYLAANDVNASYNEEEMARLGEGMTAREMAILRSFVEVRPSYLNAFFDEASAIYGSFEKYVREGLCVSSEQRERLAQMVL